MHFMWRFVFDGGAYECVCVHVLCGMPEWRKLFLLFTFSVLWPFHFSFFVSLSSIVNFRAHVLVDVGEDDESLVCSCNLFQWVPTPINALSFYGCGESTLPSTRSYFHLIINYFLIYVVSNCITKQHIVLLQDSWLHFINKRTRSTHSTGFTSHAIHPLYRPLASINTVPARINYNYFWVERKENWRTKRIIPAIETNEWEPNRYSMWDIWIYIVQQPGYGVSRFTRILDSLHLNRPIANIRMKIHFHVRYPRNVDSVLLI